MYSTRQQFYMDATEDWQLDCKINSFTFAPPNVLNLNWCSRWRSGINIVFIIVKVDCYSRKCIDRFEKHSPVTTTGFD